MRERIPSRATPTSSNVADEPNHLRSHVSKPKGQTAFLRVDLSRRSFRHETKSKAGNFMGASRGPKQREGIQQDSEPREEIAMLPHCHITSHFLLLARLGDSKSTA